MDADANANANANTDAGGSTIALREFFSGELMSKLILKESYLNDIYIFLIWVWRHIKTISLILSRVNLKVGRKREIGEKKHLTTRKQNLSCLTCDPS